MKYYTYQLIKAPNLMFNTNIGDNNFEFSFRTFRGIIYVSVRINGELKCSGIKAIPNKSLFGSVVNNAAGGIFAFLCNYDGYPTHEMFDGYRCVFAFCPYSELANG